MLNATIQSLYVVKLEGLKATWAIKKPADYRIVDGKVFLRIGPHHRSLISLIARENDNVPPVSERMKYWSLSTSTGLKTIIETRNKLQADMLTQPQDACSLFSAKPKKRLKASKYEKDEMRTSPKSMPVLVEVLGQTVDVEVLIPVNSNDNLFVACDDDMLTAVINKIRNDTFEDFTPRSKNPELPPGVRCRGKAFVVSYKKADGGVAYKTAKSLDEAKEFRADPLLMMRKYDEESDVEDPLQVMQNHEDESDVEDPLLMMQNDEEQSDVEDAAREPEE